jgi:hypothetical protein
MMRFFTGVGIDLPRMYNCYVDFPTDGNIAYLVLRRFDITYHIYYALNKAKRCEREDGVPLSMHINWVARTVDIELV